MAISTKSLVAKLTMIKLTAERADVKYVTSHSREYLFENLRIQAGPGGKRLVCTSDVTSGVYEITSFMPARELNIWLNGLWNGIEMGRK